MKALTSSLQHFIVQKLRLSNKEAVQAILTGRVLVNGDKAQLAQVLGPEDRVCFNNEVLLEPKPFIYLAYYKPRGVESTLNTQIENNLVQSLGLEQRVFPVGRLDKESEGLMLLTNNGKVYDKIIHAKSHQEKEYVVTVDKPLTPAVLDQLAAGIVIMGQKTRPALVKPINATTFTIILTQGLNRQIRRMCYKLGYQVQQLVRVRILNVVLGTLNPGEWRYMNPQELNEMSQILPA